MITPSKRSLDLLKKQGCISQVVERWNSFARKRIDLFGIIDIVAIRDKKIVGIQATSASNHTARVHKSKESEVLEKWKEAGAEFEVWSWKKVKNRWQVRIEKL